MDKYIISQKPEQPLLSELKRLIRLSSIYASGNILMLGLGFILLPLYTAYLVPAEYGVLAIAVVITTMAAIIFPLGLQVSATRFYFVLKGEERKRFLGSLWAFLILIPGVLLIFIDLNGDFLFNLFIEEIPYRPYIRLALWTGYITMAFTALLNQVLRASEKAGTCAALNIAQFLLATGLTVWFVAGLRSGVEGALWARLIAAGLVALFSAILISKFVHFSLDIDLLKRGLTYGLPLLPHLLSFWILMASDRIILQWYVPLSEVGIYTIGFQIGSVTMLFLLAGNSSMIPLFGRLDISNQADIDKLMRVITYYIFTLTFIGLVISLFSPFIINLLTPAPYHSATLVVPWIVLGYVFMALYLPCSNTVTLIVGDTRKLGIYTCGAAILNIALNIWLIPKFGMIAAAITTAATYLVLFLTVYLYAQTLQPLPYEIRRISTILGVGLVTFLVGWNILSTISWGGFLMTLTSLFIFPVILWISGFFSQQERGAALQIWSRICGRLRVVR